MRTSPVTEEKISDIISGMTIEEKILQMLQISDMKEKPGVFERFVKLGAGSFSTF